MWSVKKSPRYLCLSKKKKSDIKIWKIKNLALLCSTRHNRTLVGIVFNMKIHTVNRRYIQLPLKPSNTKGWKKKWSSAYIVRLIRTSSPTSPTLLDELNYQCQMHKIIQNYPYVSQTGAFINIQATPKECPSYFFFHLDYCESLCSLHFEKGAPAPSSLTTPPKCCSSAWRRNDLYCSYLWVSELIVEVSTYMAQLAMSPG